MELDGASTKKAKKLFDRASTVRSSLDLHASKCDEIQSGIINRKVTKVWDALLLAYEQCMPKPGPVPKLKKSKK